MRGEPLEAESTYNTFDRSIPCRKHGLTHFLQPSPIFHLHYFQHPTSRTNLVKAPLTNVRYVNHDNQKLPKVKVLSDTMQDHRWKARRSPQKAEVKTMSSSHQHLDVPISTQPIPSMHGYALTIPFEASSRPSRKRHTKIMSQAAERWGWFSRARHWDEERSTWLGTLGYFPSEIREQIIDVVLKPHNDRTILWPERAPEERNRKQKNTCGALSLTYRSNIA